MSDINSDTGTIKPPRRKGDKVEVVRILILAVVSFVLGFGLVIFFLGPSDSKAPDDLSDGSTRNTPESGSAAEEAAGAKAVGEAAATPPSEPVAEAAPTLPQDGYAPASTTSSGNPLLPPSEEEGQAAPADESKSDNSATGAASAPDEATAPPEVPPGKTPDNVALDGGAFYLKCWDGKGSETPGASCDKLPVFEKRVATRLYVVDRCKQKHTEKKSSGKLSLGIEVDFDKASLNYWNGPSSTLENAAEVAVCLRNELNGLPIQGVAHKYSRYRMFFTVLFGDAKSAAASKPTSKPTEAAADEAPAKSLPKGKLVTVLKDQVRVRKAPVDGEVIGKIGKDKQVKLIKKKGDWCQVLTPNNNEGWMICEALSK